MKAYLIVILVVLSQMGFTQDLNEISSKIKSGKIFSNEKELSEWISLCGNDTVSLFSALANSKIDSLPEDKLSNSIYLLRNLSAAKSSEKVKNMAVVFFLTSFKSRYSGVSSLSIKALYNIPVSNFKGAILDTISSYIINKPRSYKDIVLLAGYVNNPLFIETIKSVFPNARSFSKQERWASYKALARLGDQEALDFCVKSVTSLPVNDQLIDILYPDLIYIQKKEAYDILIKTLNSDEVLCSSSNPNSDSKIICGYRIMELLAPVIEGFPYKLLPSGDLDVKDYKAALIDVRAWFAKNGSNYSIIIK